MRSGRTQSSEEKAQVGLLTKVGNKKKSRRPAFVDFWVGSGLVDHYVSFGVERWLLRSPCHLIQSL